MLFFFLVWESGENWAEHFIVWFHSYSRGSGVNGQAESRIEVQRSRSLLWRSFQHFLSNFWLTLKVSPLSLIKFEEFLPQNFYFSKCFRKWRKKQHKNIFWKLVYFGSINLCKSKFVFSVLFLVYLVKH